MKHRCPPVVLSLALVAAASCAPTAPLGEDWELLDAAAKEERALAALRELFAAGVDGRGARRPDREVLACDAAGIRYRPLEGGEESFLRWADVASVEGRTLEGLPARPETVSLLLEAGSPSDESARDAVRPRLGGGGLFRSSVELRSRPRGSRRRLLAALEWLRRRAPRAGTGTAPVALVGERPPPSAARAAAGDDEAAPTSGAAPPKEEATSAAAPAASERPEVVEEKLRALERWRREGLISDEEYRAKRKELLDRF